MFTGTFLKPPAGSNNVFTNDSTPDAGQNNIDSANLAANNLGGFVTSTSNIYSFSDVMDFTIDIGAAEPHATGMLGTYNVALQVKILGSDIDDSSLTLSGTNVVGDQVERGFDVKFELSRTEAGGEFGGDEIEYLYLWQIETDTSDLNNLIIAPWFDYEFNFNAVGTSLSLGEIAIDIGLASGDLPDPPPPPVATVPIPGAIALFMPALLGALGVRQLGRRR